jgi:hypothetical protein
MRISAIIAVMALLLLAAATARAQQAWQQRQYDSLATLLRGTWTMPTTKGLLCETWGKPNGNMVQGSSYRIQGSDTLWLEHVSLEWLHGRIMYTPTTAGQNDGKPVPFELNSIDSGRFCFANLQHDFPQRIIYRFIHHDSLHARIVGTVNGRLQHRDFPYRRKD